MALQCHCDFCPTQPGPPVVRTSIKVTVKYRVWDDLWEMLSTLLSHAQVYLLELNIKLPRYLNLGHHRLPLAK